LRIHHIDRRHEEEIDALALEQRLVARLITRITREVFVRPELCRIHEDRDDDERRAGVACNANEREMALVEETHRRYEADFRAVNARGLDRGARVFDCVRY